MVVVDDTNNNSGNNAISPAAAVVMQDEIDLMNDNDMREQRMQKKEIRANLLREDNMEQLQTTIEGGDEGNNDDNNNVEDNTQAPAMGVIHSLKTHSKIEMIQLAKICWPLVITNIANALLGSTDVAFVGHLGERALASSALGNSYFQTLAFMTVGLLSAQDTLISQAEGVKNERMKRIVLYRSFVVTFILSIPIFVMFMISDHVLTLLRQDPEIVKLTATFVRLLAIGLWPFIVINILSRYLVAQSRVMFPMLCGIASNVVNVILNFLLINGIGYKGLGFIGAPIATSLTRYFIALVLGIYVIYLERQKSEENSDSTERGEVSVAVKQSTTSIIRAIFQRTGIIEYVKLAIPGMFQLCLESWAFTATGFVVGVFGHPKYLAAHTVVMSITYIMYMIPFSLSIATSVRVGICLGSKLPQNAKAASILSFIIGVLFMCFNAVQTIAFRRFSVKIFTKDADVIILAMSILPINSIFQIFDGAQTCLAGVLRGTGKQTIGAIFNFISFYILGIPLGLTLAFAAKMKLHGIWTGIAVGMFVVTIISFCYCLLRINFAEQVDSALQRVARSDVPQEQEVASPQDEENGNEEEMQTLESTEIEREESPK